ncbi:beta-lactamase family protein, partial [Paucibacter sp. B2R-40]|uniref:serine hydrolase domain-containing protein n=1 Tax=Paucibacter sp. B2R-40 TaxID=2893554 RepID=UPI0021E3D899
ASWLRPLSFDVSPHQRTMRSVPRRQVLLRVAGVLAALPGIARAASVEFATPSSETGCTFAVAKIRKAQLIEPPAEGSCRTSSGSSAIFQAASLSKPIVATLALKLMLRGKLDLDQPVSEVLPDGYVHRQNLFALHESPVVDIVPRDVLKKLTVRNLLSHTSGLPNWSSKAPLRLSIEPGAGWRYSGEGYVLLQHVLHKLTGMPLNALASAELFEPLGLQDTAFKLTEHVAHSLVPGRSASGQIRQLRFPHEIAASSLYTTASDYGRFIVATLKDQRLLSLITESSVSVPGAPGVYWGLGWAIEQSSEHRVIWHWGNNPGFRALAMADLISNDAVVVLAATESGMPQAKAAVRQILPGAHLGLDLDLVQ